MIISVESKNSARPVRLHTPATVMAAMLMAACGGGGTSDTTAPTMPTSTVLITANSGKAAWNVVTPISLTLKDASGTTLTGPLTCVSDNTTTLVVAADCSTVTGQRLGAQTFTVSSTSGVSAKASVKVTPPAQPLGSHGPASSNGPRAINLVVTQNGRALAWGSNLSGVLGQGLLESPLDHLSLPTAVKDSSGQAALNGIVAASAGDQSALALTEDGEVYSWGKTYGSVLGRTATATEDPLPGKVLGPTGTAPLQHIVAISVGGGNALALSDDGLVYSWGSYSGQAGSDPKQVAGAVPMVGGDAPLTNAVAVSAGWNWSAVLLRDGRIVTWGFGSTDGRLGQGTIVGSTVFAPGYLLSATTGQPVTGVVSLSAGYDFGLALTDSRQVLAWGNNIWGQGGQGTLYSNLFSAVLVKDGTGMAPLSGITMVAAGGTHALALDDQGRVLSWGISQAGQLGDGPNHPRINQSALPATVLATSGVGELSGIRALAAGFNQSIAVRSDGGLLIWGQGYAGGLGQGGTSTTDSYIPLTIKDESGTGTLSIGPLSYWPNLLNKAR
jgi:alpha-tubulin suppressor-like RCC1 family protein